MSGPHRNFLQAAETTALCLVLFLLVAWVFLPATANDFINFDDPDYVTANVQVQRGLTMEAVKWALLSSEAGNWHPLTWWSHMADCQFFGLKPWGHHLTSVFLHAANAMLVFLLLRRLTGATWRSLAVAGLFALHPLRVESVAWIAERKDVLSAFFGLLSLLCYARYAEGRGPTRCDGAAARRESEVRSQPAAPPVQDRASSFYLPSSLFFFYLLALLCFALGLMSKPMLVTLPFLMVLLDFWPLGRLRNVEVRGQRSEVRRQKSEVGGDATADHGLRSTPGVPLRLLTEKVPFFAAAAGASAVAFWVHQSGGHVETMTGLPLAARVGNALVSYCRYLGKLFCPANLCAYYPHPGQWPTTTVVLAGLLLTGISILVLLLRRKCPYLLMGWLWFVGSLIPVIGIVQVGAQAMADRYTYLPSVGVFVALIWGLSELAKRRRCLALPFSVAAIMALGLCTALTRRQIGSWKDSEAVFRHALTVTERNDLAHTNLGEALLRQERWEEAMGHFQSALQINPRSAEAHYNLGVGWFRQGQLDKATAEFRSALTLRPAYQEAHYNLGVALVRQGALDEAISELREAVKLKPDDPDAASGLRKALDLKNAPGSRTPAAQP